MNFSKIASHNRSLHFIFYLRHGSSQIQILQMTVEMKTSFVNNLFNEYFCDFTYKYITCFIHKLQVSIIYHYMTKSNKYNNFVVYRSNEDIYTHTHKYSHMKTISKRKKKENKNSQKRNTRRRVVIHRKEAETKKCIR